MSRRRGSEEDGGVGVLFVGDEWSSSDKLHQNQRLFPTDAMSSGFLLMDEAPQFTGSERPQGRVAHIHNPIPAMVCAHNPAGGFYHNHLMLPKDTATGDRRGVTDGHTTQLGTRDGGVGNNSPQCFRMMESAAADRGPSVLNIHQLTISDNRPEQVTMVDAAVADGAFLDDGVVSADTTVRDGGWAADDNAFIHPGVVVDMGTWVDDATGGTSRDVVFGQVGGCVDLLGTDVGAAGGVP